jgi:hypothetical protein
MRLRARIEDWSDPIHDAPPTNAVSSPPPSAPVPAPPVSAPPTHAPASTTTANESEWLHADALPGLLARWKNQWVQIELVETLRTVRLRTTDGVVHRVPRTEVHLDPIPAGTEIQASVVLPDTPYHGSFFAVAGTVTDYVPASNEPGGWIYALRERVSGHILYVPHRVCMIEELDPWPGMLVQSRSRQQWFYGRLRRRENDRAWLIDMAWPGFQLVCMHEDAFMPIPFAQAFVLMHELDPARLVAHQEFIWGESRTSRHVVHANAKLDAKRTKSDAKDDAQGAVAGTTSDDRRSARQSSSRRRERRRAAVLRAKAANANANANKDKDAKPNYRAPR